MESVLLIAGRRDLLPHFQNLIRQHFPQVQTSNMLGSDEFLVETARNQRIYFEHCGGADDTGTGWEEEELKFIREYFQLTPYVYCLSYKGINFIKQALVHIANSSDYLVDNDFGTLLPGNDFVLKMQQNPEWSWYNDLQ